MERLKLQKAFWKGGAVKTFNIIFFPNTSNYKFLVLVVYNFDKQLLFRLKYFMVNG